MKSPFWPQHINDSMFINDSSKRRQYNFTVLQIAMYNKRYYNMNDYFTLISLADALWIVFNKVLLSLPVSGT